MQLFRRHQKHFFHYLEIVESTAQLTAAPNSLLAVPRYSVDGMRTVSDSACGGIFAPAGSRSSSRETAYGEHDGSWRLSPIRP